LLRKPTQEVSPLHLFDGAAAEAFDLIAHRQDAHRRQVWSWHDLKV
jgi:hypothetical protein